MKQISIFLACILTSGCYTRYNLCLPPVDATHDCYPQEIRTWRRLQEVEATYSPADGLQIKMKGVSGSPLEDAAADIIRSFPTRD